MGDFQGSSKKWMSILNENHVVEAMSVVMTKYFSPSHVNLIVTIFDIANIVASNASSVLVSFLF